MTTGKKSGQSGGTVPLNGESKIQQASTAADVLTIQMASGSPSGSSAGRALVLRTFVPMEGNRDPVSTAAEVFSVDYTGTIAFKGGAELTATAGLAVPVTPVVDLATASAAAYVGGWGSTTLALAASHAGQIVRIPGCSAPGGVVTLPKASGLTVGTHYRLVLMGKNIDSGIHISSSLSSSDDMILGQTSGKTVQPNNTGAMNVIDLVLVDTKRWAAYPAFSTAVKWTCTGVAGA